MVHINEPDSTESGNQPDDNFIADLITGNAEPEPESEDYQECRYELLPQEPEPLDYSVAEDAIIRCMNEDDMFFETPQNTPQKEEDYPNLRNLPSNPSSPDRSLEGALWSESSSSPSEIQMDAEKAETVKQLMVNIKLPPTAIPVWASKVPEEQWKEYLFNRLHIKNKNQ